MTTDRLKKLAIAPVACCIIAILCFANNNAGGGLLFFALMGLSFAFAIKIKKHENAEEKAAEERAFSQSAEGRRARAHIMMMQADKDKELAVLNAQLLQLQQTIELNGKATREERAEQERILKLMQTMGDD